MSSSRSNGGGIFHGNSRWGRFGLRSSLQKTAIISDPTELAALLDSPRVEVMSIDELNEETVLVSYAPRKEWVEEGPASNLVVALWTTSAARLELLRHMRRVLAEPQNTLLYVDTDSLIFACKKDKCPLETGPHLGDLTNEFPDHRIREFTSAGAKSYGAMLERKADGSTEFLLKVKGLCLTEDVLKNQGLCYEGFKQRVMEFVRTGQARPMPIQYANQLRPNVRKGTVTSVPMTKIFRPLISKGLCDADSFVRPFGFTHRRGDAGEDVRLVDIPSTSTEANAGDTDTIDEILDFVAGGAMTYAMGMRG